MSTNNIEEAAEQLLRRYLTRRFHDVAAEYPKISSMLPQEGIDHLLELRRRNEIQIELDHVGDLIEIRIISTGQREV
jgi:hypothetical protein